jgi:hypothetical protein
MTDQQEARASAPRWRGLRIAAWLLRGSCSASSAEYGARAELVERHVSGQQLMDDLTNDVHGLPASRRNRQPGFIKVTPCTPA